VRDPLGEEQCLCPADFGGTLCDELAFAVASQQDAANAGQPAAASATPIAAIAGGIAGAILAVAVLVALAVAQRRRSSGATALAAASGAAPNNGLSHTTGCYTNPMFTLPEYALGDSSSGNGTSDISKAHYALGNASNTAANYSYGNNVVDDTYASPATRHPLDVFGPGGEPM